jgi:hypothetical protein
MPRRARGGIESKNWGYRERTVGQSIKMSLILMRLPWNEPLDEVRVFMISNN